MSEKEFTYSDVAEHTSKKDLYLVINDEVFNATSFVDEHPGGEEVLLDVGGQDATEAFEDVGHSDEARDILNGLKLGKLKRQEGDPVPQNSTQKVQSVGESSSGLGGNLFAIILVGIIAALAVYQYLLSSK